MDLEAYAARIAYDGDFAPSLETLRALHFAHATHVPFENLDVLFGCGVSLEPDALWRKIVLERRGGYCFEQNSLFAAVLEAAGFRVRRLAARVRLGASGIRPRTHMLLLVETEGRQWLCDTGFGMDGLLHPLPFLPGETAAQFAWKYRIVQEGAFYALQSWRPLGWVDLYAFGLEATYPVDYQVANHYTATWPQSLFRNNLLVQLPGPDVRLMLFNYAFSERTAEGVRETTLPNDDAIRDLLAKRFSLEVPPGTHFPIPAK